VAFVVPPGRRQNGQVGVLREAAVRLGDEQCAALVGHDEGPAVRQEVEAQRQRSVPEDGLVPSAVVDSNDLAGDPVAEPQPPVVPAGRFHEPESAAQHVHPSLLCRVR
jgi:hypothetical protein